MSSGINILGLLRERQVEIEHQMCSSPPADWPAFKERLGRWNECQEMVSRLEEAARKREQEFE